MDGLNPEQYDLAEQYCLRLCHDSYYATAMVIPVQFDNLRGSIMLTSTPQSTATCMEDAETTRLGSMITDPHWLYCQVWYFAGLVPGNIAGITDSIHNGHAFPGVFRDFLKDFFERKGVPYRKWMSDFCMIQAGYFRESLRVMLRRVFSCHFWQEITVGTSWQGYLCLDMYSTYMSAGMNPPSHEAWYLLNAEYPPLQRRTVYPEYWWTCKTLVSIGQRERINDWLIERDGMLIPRSRM